MADGSLYTWGRGDRGQLGHGDEESQPRPIRLDKTLFGASPAVQVACGYAYTVVLTADNRVLTCGAGDRGQLGHGDTVNKLVLTQVGVEHFKGVRIVMVAAGDEHSAAVGEDGSVCTWGCGHYGRLGLNDEEDRLVPTQLTDEAMGEARVVMVATGGLHTVVVAHDGVLWVWGFGEWGQLGLGDNINRLVPIRVAVEAFGGSQVLMAACGYFHTLAVTEDGEVYSCSNGEYGQPGHNNDNNRPVFTRIAAQHFGLAKIVSASAGLCHSSAVTEDGALYTWGLELGPGHGDGEDKWVPTRVAAHLLHGTRVGRYHSLLPQLALAFAMGTHPRLGSADETAVAGAHTTNCAYASMPAELVQRVVEACVLWPEGRTGDLEGVVRLLGGGMTKVRVST